MPTTEKPKAEAKDSVKAPKKNPLPYKFKGLDKKIYRLTAKQKAWCDVFLGEGANLTIASLETYKITNKHLSRTLWKLLSDNDKTKRKRAENTASKIGQQNFRKLPIQKYIHKILDDEGITGEKVKLRHFQNIMQDRSLSASNQAIDMYYKRVGEYKPLEIKHGINVRLEEFLDKQDKRLP